MGSGSTAGHDAACCRGRGDSDGVYDQAGASVDCPITEPEGNVPAKSQGPQEPAQKTNLHSGRYFSFSRIHEKEVWLPDMVDSLFVLPSQAG